MDYYEQIKQKHCAVSYSESRRVFYICLWNGVLRDGKVDDIDIQFIEATNPKIINNSLVYSNKNIYLTDMQLKHLAL